MSHASRVFLRSLLREDLDVFTRLFSDPNVMAFSEGPKGAEQVATWMDGVFERHEKSPGMIPYAITLKDTGEVMGYCGLSINRYLNRPEIAYRLLPEYWGHGYGQEAAETVLSHAFNDLQLESVMAQIDPNNTPSIKLAEKLGMNQVGEVMPEGYDYPDYVFEIRA